MGTPEENAANAKLAIAAVQKQFGREAISLSSLSSEDAGDRVDAKFKSGSPALDLALGIGGYPAGRIIEVYGPDRDANEAIALHALAEAQQVGGVCAFIDVEHAFNIKRADMFAINVSKLLVSQPDTGDQALDIAEVLARSGAVDLVVVDSVSCLASRAEIEGESYDSESGLRARLMSQALRKLTAIAYRTGTTILFLRHLSASSSPIRSSDMAGGNALKFYASLRLDVKRRQEGCVIGPGVLVKVAKNKLAPPFQQAEIPLSSLGVFLSTEG